MSKVWWQVVVIVVCAAGGAVALDVQGLSSVGLAAPPEVAESASGPPAASPLSTAERLQAMSAEERSNARLSLEGVDALGEVERQQARQVEALWAEGRHDEAIAVLASLEAGGAKLAAAIAWRQPVASQPKGRGADARIGGTRQGAEDVALDFDQPTGNLFAVVAWGGGDPGWSVNISTDGGLSWAETYFWYPDSLVDAAVVDQYLYVAYAPSSNPSELRVRRFFVDDGSADTAYNFFTVANVSPNTVLDVSLGSSADGSDNQIYCYFIESNNALRYFWSNAAGTTWNDVSPAINDAESNLDFEYSGGTNYFSWVSYWGTDGTGHVLGREGGGTWSAPHALTGVPNSTRVRVSAFKRTVFVSYQFDIGSGRLAARYDVTYNEGAAWDWGDAYIPDVGEPACLGMDVTARGGWGSAVIFNREDGAFDNVYVVTREDYASGAWNPPEAFNEVDAFSGAPSFIQYLRPLGAVGVVYLAGSSWETSIPYFDTIALMPFSDGFDHGDTSAWSDEVP